MEILEELLETEWLNNNLEQYAESLVIFIGVYLGLYIFKKFVLSHFKSWAKKTHTDVDDEVVDIIDNAPHSLYLYLGLYLGLENLNLIDWLERLNYSILVILAVYWTTHIASHIVGYLLLKVKKKDKNEAKSNIYFAINLVLKFVLWSVGLLLILSNLDVDITALVASLGIGGIAVALAAQNILGDIFSSFSIYLDKPFELEDYIIIGDHQGTVKKIGIKTTRIQALQGEEIVVSNKELTSTRIRNLKRMRKRRVAFGFGVTYDIPSKKLEKIPQMIEKIIEKVEMTEFDRTHFKEFADFSLNFEVVYFIKSKEYVDYMNIQQEINFAIKRAFEKEKIEMAFPTQTLHVLKG